MQNLSQVEQVEKVIKKNGGLATLGFLYQNVDVTSWASRTPFASIRRIVQVNSIFFRIKPGLWGLTKEKENLIRQYGIFEKKSEKEEIFNHSYYQGLIIQIGTLKGYKTFVPNQDKNKKYLNQVLKDIVSTNDIYPFAYPEILSRAKTVDVIWFNERKMPSAFFEVEHSTDIYNSLIKFADLQDFNSKFKIIADNARKREFEAKIKSKVFSEIIENIKFINYEQIAEMHSNIFKHYKIQNEIDL